MYSVPRSVFEVDFTVLLLIYKLSSVLAHAFGIYYTATQIFKLAPRALRSTQRFNTTTVTVDMFCTSLRKRPDWNLVPPMLLAQKQPKWQGMFLDGETIGRFLFLLSTTVPYSDILSAFSSYDI